MRSFLPTPLNLHLIFFKQETRKENITFDDFAKDKRIASLETIATKYPYFSSCATHTNTHTHTTKTNQSNNNNNTKQSTTNPY